MQTIKCDRKGRLYLKQSLRAKYGDRFVAVESRDGLKLLPLSKDPLKDLREVLAPLSRLSSAQIKKKIRRRAKREVLSDLR